MSPMLEDLLEEEDERYASKKKTVLVIENNSSYRHKLVEMLKQKGYKVETAKSAYEGINKYERIKPDVVIIGKDLPNINGIATASLLKEYHPSCNIILTAPYPISKDSYQWIRPYKALNRYEAYFKLEQTIEELLEKERLKYRSYYGGMEANFGYR